MAAEAAERETVITTDDEEKGYFVIWTAQKPWVTSIRSNPAAVILDEGEFSGTKFIKARLPINLLSKPRKPRGAAKVAGAKRTPTAAKCSANKADGNPCGRIARKDTGKCPAHSE
jgi:hypothetical protein